MSSIAVMTADTVRLTQTLDKFFKVTERGLDSMSTVVRKATTTTQAAIKENVNQVEVQQAALQKSLDLTQKTVASAASAATGTGKSVAAAANAAAGAANAKAATPAAAQTAQKKTLSEELREMARKSIAGAVSSAVFSSMSDWVSAAFGRDKAKTDAAAQGGSAAGKAGANAAPNGASGGNAAGAAEGEKNKKPFSLIDAIAPLAEGAAKKMEGAFATYLFDPTKENLKVMKQSFLEIGQAFLKDSLTAWMGDISNQFKDWMGTQIKSFFALFKDPAKGEEGISFSDRVGNFLTNAFKGIGDIFSSIMNNITPIGNGIGNLLGSITGLLGKVLTSFSGGIGGIFSSLFGGLFGGMRANGGPVASGRAYLVGERGPELFMPSGSGVIAPNHQLASAAPAVAPIVNVRNINVLDPSVVGDYLGTDAGEQLIMNVVQRNRRALSM